jgi:hypothetical protein
MILIIHPYRGVKEKVLTWVRDDFRADKKGLKNKQEDERGTYTL